MTYPTVMRIFYITPLLFFLRTNRQIHIIFDVHNLKIEQQEVFKKRKVGFLERIFYRLIDYLYLGLLADTIITVSPRMDLLLRKLYCINSKKMYICTNSSFTKEIKVFYGLTKPFSILYA